MLVRCLPEGAPAPQFQASGRRRRVVVHPKSRRGQAGVKMSSMIGRVSVLCAALLIGVAGRAQNQEAHPETTRLIKSIQGAALYQAYCAVCHGKDGKGDGPMAKSLKVKVPDLTTIAARHGGTFPLEQVQNIISGEDAKPAGHGTRDMPVWGPIFSQIAWDQDLGRVRVYNLAKYIEGLQSTAQGSNPKKP
jgi:mono/diheme cytochrome c family protein